MATGSVVSDRLEQTKIWRFHAMMLIDRAAAVAGERYADRNVSPFRDDAGAPQLSSTLLLFPGL
jgi:hypothetical protein